MAIEALTNPTSTIQNINAMGSTDTSYANHSENTSVAASNQTKDSSQNQSENNSKQGGFEIENAQEVSAEKIKKAVEDMNQRVRPSHTSCQFSFHEETNRISIKVIDDEKDKVIREIPGEKALDIIAKTLELEGLLLDEKR